MNKNFEKICRMSQEELKKYAERRLKNTHKEVISEDGFVYAPGSFPVLLVAHMDTVHAEKPRLVTYHQNGEIVSSPQGIGGDDRCGVYMIFQVLEKFNCSVLFCEDEEIGGVGAEKFVKSKVSNGLAFNYIIEFDRKGSNDAVFYSCDNEDFEEFITKEFFSTNWGSFSDISILAPYLGAAAVNLSCGYYNAHQKAEFVNLVEMQEIIVQACKILERTTEDDVFEYIESKYDRWGDYNYSGYGWYNGGGYSNNYGGSRYNYSSSLEQNYYVIEYVDTNNHIQWYDTWAVSTAEAIGKLLMENHTLTYGDVIDLCYDSSSTYS